MSQVCVLDLLRLTDVCRFNLDPSVSTPGSNDVRLSEGRGQNNQQPTPNDSKMRVVVFLCVSGIQSPQGDVLHAFRQDAGGKGRASDGEDMRLGMVLTPLQPTTVVRKSPGIEEQ